VMNNPKELLDCAVCKSFGRASGVLITEIHVLKLHHVREEVAYNEVFPAKVVLILHKKCVIYIKQRRCDLVCNT
jgi:hypothetical protein